MRGLNARWNANSAEATRSRFRSATVDVKMSFSRSNSSISPSVMRSAAVAASSLAMVPCSLKMSSISARLSGETTCPRCGSSCTMPEKVTSIFLVPAQWQVVCAAQRADPRQLRVAGAVVGYRPRIRRPAARHVRDLPRHPDLRRVRPTEMSPVTCMLLADDAIRKLGSVGKVIPTLRGWSMTT